MTTTPTNIVHQATHDAWIARARDQGDFCDLTRDEQDRLAHDFGQRLDPNLDAVGRLYWATSLQRRLVEGWAVTSLYPEVTLGTMGM